MPLPWSKISIGAFVSTFSLLVLLICVQYALAGPSTGDEATSRSWKTQNNLNTLSTQESSGAEPTVVKVNPADVGKPVAVERKLKKQLTKKKVRAAVDFETPPPGRYVDIDTSVTPSDTANMRTGAIAPAKLKVESANSSSSDGTGGVWQGRYVDAEAERSDDPTIAAINETLSEPEKIFSKSVHKDDLAALREFYDHRASAPLWLDASGINARGNAVIREFSKADNWGLSKKAYDFPKSVGITEDSRARAELQMSGSVLKYVRHARGGRVSPRSLTRLLDQEPELADPLVVLNEIEGAAEPDGYLRSQHPTYPQFANLRKALLKARGVVRKPLAGGAAEIGKLKKVPVTIPDDAPTLRSGMSHPAVAKLRARLEVPTTLGSDANLFDGDVKHALIEFQSKNGMERDGVVGPLTRDALNGGSGKKNGKRKLASKKSRIQKIILNMERWRWMPRNPGAFYVFNNIPEFQTRVFKDGTEIYGERIIVGKTKNPTPAFSADMQLIVFHPSWSVPNGIKQTEILPYLKQKTGFFGLGGADTRILTQHNLRVSQNGHPVDASKINWSEVDIRQFHFTQPPSSTNVLGKVKFRFPNRHDVYMHDTPERHLFAQTRRAESHGCIRVRNPRRLAEILLEHDKGWSTEKVARLWNGYGSGAVKLDEAIPVHTAYFTAWADEDGNLRTFGDLYGNDGRTARALGKRPIYDSSDSIAQNSGSSPSSNRPKKQKKKKNSGSSDTVADILMNAFSP